MTETVLDVRPVAPAERHALVFSTFDALAPGGAFILAADHDPRPLYSQFGAQRSGKFEWSYVEQGPKVWRVRIARAREGASCCGSCS